MTDAGIQEPSKGEVEPSQAAAAETTAVATTSPLSAAEALPVSEATGIATAEPSPPADEKAPEATDSTAATDSAEAPAAGPASAESAPAESPHDGGQVTGETPVHEEHEHAPFDFVLKGPDGVGTGSAAAALARRDRRQPNPIRTVVGVVVSGLLGLAVAYGLVVGLSKLGCWSNSEPAAAEGEDSGTEARPAKTQSKETSPSPEPKSFEEWPDLDENRFTGATKDVQPSKSVRAPKGSGGRKGP